MLRILFYLKFNIINGCKKLVIYKNSPHITIYSLGYFSKLSVSLRFSGLIIIFFLALINWNSISIIFLLNLEIILLFVIHLINGIYHLLNVSHLINGIYHLLNVSHLINGFLNLIKKFRNRINFRNKFNIIFFLSNMDRFGPIITDIEKKDNMKNILNNTLKGKVKEKKIT